MALTFLHCQAKLGELSIYVGCLARQYRNEPSSDETSELRSLV